MIAPGTDAGVGKLDGAIVGPGGGLDGNDGGDAGGVALKEGKVFGIGFDRNDGGVRKALVEVESRETDVGTEIEDGVDRVVERRIVFAVENDFFPHLQVGGREAKSRTKGRLA